MISIFELGGTFSDDDAGLDSLIIGLLLSSGPPLGESCRAQDTSRILIIGVIYNNFFSIFRKYNFIQNLSRLKTPIIIDFVLVSNWLYFKNHF
jgi:hypothetical protein